MIDHATLNMGDSHLIVDICRQHHFPPLPTGDFPAPEGMELEPVGGDGNPLTGIEIGCYRGATSQKLLQTFPTLFLYMVDSWHGSLPDDDPYRLSGDSVAKLTQAQQDDNRAAAEAATSFGCMSDRRTVLKLTSEVASQRLAGRSLCFAFLDGCHTYEAVKRDIGLWWPRVRIGGILAGHDFGHRRHTGVEQAVREFTESIGLDFRLKGSCWWTVKP